MPSSAQSQGVSRHDFSFVCIVRCLSYNVSYPCHQGPPANLLILLQVGGIHWFQKEARGIKALTSPAWKEPAKSVTALHNLYVRENDKSLLNDYPGLRELGLRGRPRPIMIPSACDNLSLAYQVPILLASLTLSCVQRSEDVLLGFSTHREVLGTPGAVMRMRVFQFAVVLYLKAPLFSDRHALSMELSDTS